MTVQDVFKPVQRVSETQQHVSETVQRVFPPYKTSHFINRIIHIKIKSNQIDDLEHFLYKNYSKLINRTTCLTYFKTVQLVSNTAFRGKAPQTIIKNKLFIWI